MSASRPAPTVRWGVGWLGVRVLAALPRGSVRRGGFVGVSAIRVLGPVEVWSDERRLVLGGPRQIALLAFLLLHANRAVSADAVIDAVWGPRA